MNICRRCDKEFPSSATIEGKRRFLHTRKHCLECVPLGSRPKQYKTKISDFNKKYCGWCDKTLNTSSFYKRGRGGTMNYCKECYRANSRRVYERDKTKAIKLMGGRCVRCGYNKCIAAFDFHHPDPAKKEVSLNQFGRKSFDVLLKEISKCILLCANCHREAHYDNTRGN